MSGPSAAGLAVVVSAHLREAGLPVRYARERGRREGVYVTSASRTSVAVVFDFAVYLHAHLGLFGKAETALRVRGYGVDVRRDGEVWRIYVTRTPSA